MNEEHNMTLRERYYAWNKKLGDYPSAKMSADWFLAQFDAMLAEDIEKMKERIKSNHLGISFDYGVEECIDYLEARRLSIKE